MDLVEAFLNNVVIGKAILNITPVLDDSKIRSPSFAPLPLPPALWLFTQTRPACEPLARVSSKFLCPINSTSPTFRPVGHPQISF